MSPEQVRGTLLDKRTDIWAFGCVLTEMLSGRRVFAGDTVPDAITAILGREPDWNLLPAGTPLAVRRLLQRCLEKDVKQRLRDIGDVPADIDHDAGRSAVGDLGCRILRGSGGAPATCSPSCCNRHSWRCWRSRPWQRASGECRGRAAASRVGVPFGLDAADELPRLSRPAVALAGWAHADLHSRAELVHDLRSGVRQDAARWRAEAVDQRHHDEDESRVFTGWIANRLHHVERAQRMGHVGGPGSRRRAEAMAAECLGADLDGPAEAAVLREDPRQRRQPHEDRGGR